MCVHTNARGIPTVSLAYVGWHQDTERTAPLTTQLTSKGWQPASMTPIEERSKASMTQMQASQRMQAWLMEVQTGQMRTWQMRTQANKRQKQTQMRLTKRTTSQFRSWTQVFRLTYQQSQIQAELPAELAANASRQQVAEPREKADTIECNSEHSVSVCRNC